MEKEYRNSLKKYRSTKYLHKVWRLEFQFSLIDALAEEEQLPKSIIEKRIKREEKQRDMGRKARYIRGKGIKDPIYRTITTNKDCETIEHNDQASMVSVIAESNRIRQQQCTGTPFMTSPLVDIFGHLASEEAALQVMNVTFDIPAKVDPIAAALIKKLERIEEIKSKEEISLYINASKNKKG